MTHALVTIVAPLVPDRIGQASRMIDALKNPARPDLKDALDKAIDADGSATHFASFHALPSFTAGRAHLILEFSADGTPAQAIARLVGAIGTHLQPIFALAKDWQGDNLGAYLAEHTIPSGYTYGKPAGIAHVGAPGMSVGLIRDEDKLAEAARDLLAKQGGQIAPMTRLVAVRDALKAQFPALLKETPPALPDKILSIPAAGLKRLPDLITTFLWPLAIPLLLWVAACGAFAAMHPRPFGPPPHPLLQALHGAWHGLVTGLPWVLVVVIAVYLRLRWLESLDWVSERFPTQHLETEMAKRENHCAQNHMVSLTRLKPGIVRRITMRLGFWAIAQIGSLAYRPGYLGPIGTIHFARWVTVPGTRDLLFLSNYGGSWQAYLEDFITLAHYGLTAVWSNTVGFPRASNLFLQGATDADRFKRYARQSMLPTRFWYSAYPEIDTDMIRANAAIRRGLVGAMSEDDAVAWLARFGSATRPATQLVTDEIQSMVFGGMGFLKASRMTLWQLPDDRAAAQAFFAEVSQHVAYDDGRRLGRKDREVDAIVQLAISAPGFRALGLPEAAMASFPPPFTQGMAAPARARILGDAGLDAPDKWWWGGKSEPHLALIVLGKDKGACDTLQDTLGKAATLHGAALTYQLPMEDYDPGDNHEPFGFVDGISQPVIRGTYKGSTRGDKLHLCEPGEFILGYPDNRGETPPGPSVSAGLDPAGKLPVRGSDPSLSTATINHPREIGRNGSYLVIRHLEQDPEAFNGYCIEQASALQDRLPAPYLVDKELIAAKIVGRWRNGAPIVRAPYSDTISRRQAEAARDDGAPKDANITFANTFLLGEEDPEGLRCPFGAHIRRANPRDSLNPGSTDQVAISNRHRILRVGRKYGPGAAARPDKTASDKPGLVFLALNADLERQFEFIQQTWIQGNVISLTCPISLKGETDPLLGSGDSSGYTVPSHDGLVRLAPPPRFVTVRGGGYFFMPGRSVVNWLASPRTDAPSITPAGTQATPTSL